METSHAYMGPVFMFKAQDSFEGIYNCLGLGNTVLKTAKGLFLTRKHLKLLWTDAVLKYILRKQRFTSNVHWHPVDKKSGPYPYKQGTSHIFNIPLCHFRGSRLLCFRLMIFLIQRTQ